MGDLRKALPCVMHPRSKAAQTSKLKTVRRTVFDRSAPLLTLSGFDSLQITKQKSISFEMLLFCGVSDGSRTHGLQGHNLTL